MGETFLSIVIPAFNEELRISDSLEQIVRFLTSQDYTWQVLVADDGSTDATARLVTKFAQAHPNIRLLNLPHRGKGWAVKNGMIEATGQYRFLCDADLSMPIEQVERFLPPHLAGTDVAIGSRQAPGSRRIGEPGRRHLMGRVFNLLVRLLAVPGVEDTQCGFKCFRGEAAQDLFQRQKLHGFAFDAEVLFLAGKEGLVLLEVPIDWYYRERSKVRPFRDSLNMTLDLFRIRWRYLRGGYRT